MFGESIDVDKQDTIKTHWRYVHEPPTYGDVVDWLLNLKNKKVTNSFSDCNINTNFDLGHINLAASDRRTFDNTQLHTPRKHHFKYPTPKKYKPQQTPIENNNSSSSFSNPDSILNNDVNFQDMSLMCMELFIQTREDYYPDPEKDAIRGIFWKIRDTSLLDRFGISEEEGILICQNNNSEDQYIDDDHHLIALYDQISTQMQITIEHFGSEKQMLERLIELVNLLDPDILSGFEIHKSSWGYLIDRASKFHDIEINKELSRLSDLSKLQSEKKLKKGQWGRRIDKWGLKIASGLKVQGRHLLNVWRHLRSDLNLLGYSFENVVFHLLHERVPHYSYRTMTQLFNSRLTSEKELLIRHIIKIVRLSLIIIDTQRLISRTEEQARLIGIDFYSVFTRGSQYNVESLLFRLTKAENYILLSPSKKQVSKQDALECLPLVMEPESKFYTSPLVVLDFQSLYPSVMIAYNYCYSTCLGRLKNNISSHSKNKLGVETNLNIPSGLLELLKNDITISPNGLMFVKPTIRKSTLSKLLAEMLDTRIMVKSAMSKYPSTELELKKTADNRQLALKLIANVTYGYTAATFSGRMPCTEIADSIVQTGRETLEKAIDLIQSNEDKWGGQVVYGDTDSLFINFPGKSKEDAFKIGKEIANKVTSMNPEPIKLKFEKVYHPCILLAKKRYVGYSYESEDQKVPKFDAKGIETVRRDGTPAQQKIVEKTLKILFDTTDLSAVKRYITDQFSKIMLGTVSVHDFCFAKEVKLGTYKKSGNIPPGALLSAQKTEEDQRAEPEFKERIRYVVIKKKLGTRLKDRCVLPSTMINDASLQLDSAYYIEKNIIPPLERIFNVMGVNVKQWYDDMPKMSSLQPTAAVPSLVEESLTTISTDLDNNKYLHTFTQSQTCVSCHEPLEIDDKCSSLCPSCLSSKDTAINNLMLRVKIHEKQYFEIESLCRFCINTSHGTNHTVQCTSEDCPLYYKRVRTKRRLELCKLMEVRTLEELSDW